MPVPSSESSRATGMVWRSLRLLGWVAGSGMRLMRTFGRIVAAGWTRRMPPDDDLVAVAWQLAVIGVASPFLAEGIHWFHNLVDPPRGGWLPGLGRAISYILWSIGAFFVTELSSIAACMWVARRKRRVLWWLVPQMLVVFSLVGVFNALLTVTALNQSGITTPPNDDEAMFLLSLLGVSGAIAFTAWWTWRVCSISDAERLAKELEAERPRLAGKG